MQWKNTTVRYGALSVGLHWLMLLLIAAVYALIELRGLFPKGTPERDAMKHWHFTLGLLVFVLAWLRLAARCFAPTPRIEPPPPRWQIGLSSIVHLLLYAMMLGLPMAGWLLVSAEGQSISFFGLPLPALAGPDKALAERVEYLHETVATVGYAVIGLHAAAALIHHYLMHDNTLTRMLPTHRTG